MEEQRRKIVPCWQEQQEWQVAIVSIEEGLGSPSLHLTLIRNPDDRSAIATKNDAMPTLERAILYIISSYYFLTYCLSTCQLEQL